MAIMTREEMEESQLDLVLSHQLRLEECVVEDLAEAWINTYETSQIEAVRFYLELILHSTGFSQPMTAKQILELDQLTVVTFDDWISQPNVKPLITEISYFENLQKFLKLTLLGDVCLNDIIIMKRINNLLQILVNSTWAFARYTALNIGLTITDQYMIYWSYLVAELRNLLGTGNEMDIRGKIDVVENFFKQFIYFVTLCTRDVILEIRTIASSNLFRWCHQKEKLVMKDIYLRSVYWTLFEDNATIRASAVLACRALLRNQYVLKNLGPFMKKILPIIVRRTNDESNRIAIAALITMIDVHRQSPQLLKEINVEPILNLIYEDNPITSAKASEFLHDMLQNISSSNMEFIINSILFIDESVVEIGENASVEGVVKVFVEHIVPKSYQLADWSAWGQLLLGNSLYNMKHLQEIACLLLVNILDFLSICADDRDFIETDYPPPPSSGGCEVNSESKKTRLKVDETEKERCLNDLVRITSELGPVLVPLWKKYKCNTKCLRNLVTILQYFNGTMDNLDMKQICCYLTLLRNEFDDSPTLIAVHRSMAFLYYIMSVSQKWKHSIPKFKHVFFTNVIGNFEMACAWLTKQPLPDDFEMYFFLIAKKAAFLSRFFNLSNTSLSDNALYALRLGTAVSNDTIIHMTALMCLYNLKWQLKEVIEGNLDKNKLEACLYKIQSQSRTLVIQLESVLVFSNSFVKEIAYSVMCQVHIMFNPRNGYTSRYPPIHLPCPSLIAQEMLNNILLRQVSLKNIPQDEGKFIKASEALRKFCLMLETQNLDATYISSIFCYLKFYHCKRNYNSILESTLEFLAKTKKDYLYKVIGSLMWIKANTDINVEGIAKGLCAVSLSKLKPQAFAQKIVLDILRYGLSLIKSEKEHCNFLILAPFVKLLRKKDAERLFTTVSDTFHLYTEKEEVKIFLAAFGSMTNK